MLPRAVLDFGLHGHSIVVLIKALPILALFVFVNADVYANSARELDNELNGE